MQVGTTAKAPGVPARPRRLSPTEVHEGPALEPVYVWDVVVRVSHWLVVFTMILLVITGIDIARPIFDTGSGKSGFTHGWVRVVHFYGAMVFSLAVGARLIWMVTGPRHSGWRTFIPSSKRRLRGLGQTLLFYAAIKPRPPDSIGHNPMAGLTYIFVFGLYLLMIFSGFALYSVSSYTSYMEMWQFLLPIFNGPQGARWIHHVTMWLLIIFIVQHLFSAVLTSISEKNGCVDSMFSGYKYLPKDRKTDDDVE